jgi:ADP-ribose pyrophosphatase YjhB (NUDIX family)
MSCIHLATALVRRENNVLLVASHYPNHARALWNMPGGRQQTGELLTQTAVRELTEETGMTGTVRRLCYVSESYDGTTHFTNFTFEVYALGDPQKPHVEGDHVVDAAWVPIESLSERIAVAVVREPLVAYLRGSLPHAYAGYADAGITIEFPD